MKVTEMMKDVSVRGLANEEEAVVVDVDDNSEALVLEPVPSTSEYSFGNALIKLKLLYYK